MHKGEFYAIVFKDAKDIKCIIEMFKIKSTRHRSKPRMVFLQGREDDAIISARAGQGQKEIYIVPARRRAKGIHVITFDTCANDKVQITPSDEIEPRFRTPCASLHDSMHKSARRWSRN